MLKLTDDGLAEYVVSLGTYIWPFNHAFFESGDSRYSIHGYCLTDNTIQWAIFDFSVGLWLCPESLAEIEALTKELEDYYRKESA